MSKTLNQDLINSNEMPKSKKQILESNNIEENSMNSNENLDSTMSQKKKESNNESFDMEIK